MAVKTETLYAFLLGWIRGIWQPVAGEAFCIGLREWGQGRTLLVTGPALLVAGPVGVKFSQSVGTEPSLTVRPMATDTEGVLLLIGDLLGAVGPVLQVFYNVVVAGEADLFAKEVGSLRIHPIRVGVRPALGNVVVAVLTTGLAVSGDVELTGIDQPRCLSWRHGRHENHDGDQWGQNGPKRRSQGDGFMSHGNLFSAERIALEAWGHPLCQIFNRVG
jgi:hypothetical protein